MGKLDGKVALITGGGSGIGQATALLFAEEGAKITVADSVPTGGQETVRKIREAGGEGTFVEVDVSKAADVERMVKTTMDTYGRIDILFNNAGITGKVAPTAEITEEDWDLVLDTNLKGAFLGTKYVLPVMLKQGGGAIINTSSCQGIGIVVNMAPYNVSKAGIIHLTKTTALEYTAQNIRVNCICPGTIQTAMSEPWIPLLQIDFLLQGRVGQPEEIARAALYLASDDSSYVTGHALVVDGGWIPGAVPLIKAQK
jgi:NAD(P)-dependent dehydrogenase (short-subunit alcohol dehydrogenase family)